MFPIALNRKYRPHNDCDMEHKGEFPTWILTDTVFPPFSGIKFTTLRDVKATMQFSRDETAIS